MTTRMRMTHRAEIQRAGQTAEDAYGHPIASEWAEHIPALPCWFDFAPAGSNDERALPEGTPVILDALMLCPVGSDVVETDRVAAVFDRAWNRLTVGPLDVRAVMRRHDHLEVRLQEVH